MKNKNTFYPTYMPTQNREGKINIKKGAKYALLITAVFAVAYYVAPAKVEYVTETQIISQRAETIDELKEAVLDELEACESEHKNVIVWDDYGTGRNRASFGTFQFKVGTVQHYYYLIHGVELSDADAVKLALDEERARAFAKSVIFDVTGGIFDWEICSRKNNLVGKVELIKEMQK